MKHVHHNKDLDEIAVLLAREIYALDVSMANREREGQLIKSKAPRERDRIENNARVNGLLMGLSTVLYGTWAHVHDAMDFVATKPWEK